MPRIKRDKDGIFWRGGWAYLQYKGRHALRTKDKETARKLAVIERRRIDDPSHAAAHVTTLARACEAFRSYAATGENRAKPPSPETFKMYETHFGNLCGVMGSETPLENIDAAAIDSYIATRRAEPIGKAPGTHKGRPARRVARGIAPGPDTRRKVSANTVDKELGTLRQILRLGLRRGWYHLPLEKVLPESSGGRYVPLTRALTLEEVPKLLAALRPERAAYCAYIVAFGADVCAAERATRDDLGGPDACNLRVLIRGTKNAKRWAEVPLVHPFQPFAELAREYLARFGSFAPWGKQRCRDLDVACRRAGLARITPRDLRRTHGQILASLGLPPHLIGEMLRHADSRMAETTYGQRTRETVGRQVAAVTRKTG